LGGKKGWSSFLNEKEGPGAFSIFSGLTARHLLPGKFPFAVDGPFPATLLPPLTKP
jgi:hypothetical protein